LTLCLFVSDLHAREDRYRKLFQAIADRLPAGVLLGGDLLPPWSQISGTAAPDFVHGFLEAGFERLKDRLGARYPSVFVILGNDDAKYEEAALLDGDRRGLWLYAHERKLALGDHWVMGYSFVPPTPFAQKDWERYDVSRYVDPGCVSPEEGWRSVPLDSHQARYATIEKDLERLFGAGPLDSTVCLFHTPPYRTKLDRAALDGQHVDHVPLDVHVGSIAVRKFIEARQPLITLHGHVHESARLTGSWRDRIGRTHLFTAAHDGPELALVSFDLENPEAATRELL
jgi:Icc-related predicted phosphoesterase